MSEPSPETSQPTTTSELAFAEGDPTVFLNHYPTLPDLLSKGGIEGVEYCLVDGKNLRKFANMSENKRDCWSPIRDLPTLTIIGPKGTAESVVLMGRGDPTYGASDFNGVRSYYVDVDIEEAIGLPANPESPVANKTTNLPTPDVVQTSEGRKKPKDEDIQVIKGK